jgi:hypothetical protein
MPLGDWPIFTANAEPDRGRCAATHFHYRQPRKHHHSLRIIATL